MNTEHDWDGVIPHQACSPELLADALSWFQVGPERVREVWSDLIAQKLIAEDLTGIRIVGWDRTWRPAKSATERSDEFRARQEEEERYSRNDGDVAEATDKTLGVEESRGEKRRKKRGDARGEKKTKKPRRSGSGVGTSASAPRQEKSTQNTHPNAEGYEPGFTPEPPDRLSDLAKHLWRLDYGIGLADTTRAEECRMAAEFLEAEGGCTPSDLPNLQVVMASLAECKRRTSEAGIIYPFSRNDPTSGPQATYDGQEV
ncbi:MAG: hypothetical protein ACE5M4_09140 [Anaerolineales bacterium]